MHDLPPNITQKEADQFIYTCHKDLESVKDKVTSTPSIVNVYNPKVHETALGAAGHMGNRPIAEYLLENGAQLELAAAAMLGMRTEVAKWLSEDPALASSGGAHNISVAFHTAMSNDTGIMQMLLDNGAVEPVKQALHGAIMKGHVEMTEWLLDHDADTNVKNFQDKSPQEVAKDSGLTDIINVLNQHAE